MKTYTEMIEFLTSLGWKESGNWNNRTFYSIDYFIIVEHNGNLSIAKDDDWYFVPSTTEEMIVEFTNIVKTIYYDEDNPEKVTLADYINHRMKLVDFYKKYEGYQDNDNEDIICV